MKLTFLGTGAGLPAKQRNVTATALQWTEDQSETWLFDCGEGTQRQILHTSIRPGRITKIFISHLHGDHIYGLPGLLSSRSFLHGENVPLDIYGPKGLKEYLEVSLNMSGTSLSYPWTVHELEEGRVFEDKYSYVDVLKLEHTILSYGFRVVEKDKQGALLVEKLQSEGLTPGPLFQQFKEREEVKLEDGRLLRSKDFLGSPKKGRVVAVLGDTRLCENSIELAKNADVLVHEATYAEEDKADQAWQYGHSTAHQAVHVANKAGVRQLILTHLSSRYQDDRELTESLIPLQNNFSAIEIAQDFMSFSIERGE
ncbi:ribonuclease Z [Bacillaceae bacterium SIJ1]|uniref:ribonuclease Z n=1 Tax=Litoribacterium kuwaitense TaxID=1398745 RepID=UPI0013EA19C5|nr:ribonuclease Z [Litoribacterium kuwaitense]NGP43633.1 ribonuclease Z [Litoribacterium kuwaitense]